MDESFSNEKDMFVKLGTSGLGKITVDLHEDGDVSAELNLADTGGTFGSNGKELVVEARVLSGRSSNREATLVNLVLGHHVAEGLELSFVEQAVIVGVASSKGRVELSFLLILRSSLSLGLAFSGAVGHPFGELERAVFGEESDIGIRHLEYEVLNYRMIK